MNTPYRVLALDIDGTLLKNDKTVSPRTLRALAACQDLGVRLVLVTGRRHPAARRVAEKLGGGMPLILHNGALTIEAGEVMHRELLSRSLASEAVRIGLRAGADPVVHMGPNGEGRLLVARVSPSNTLLAYYLDKSHPDVTVVEDLECALTEDPIQVMFGGTITEMDALFPFLKSGLGDSTRIERTVYVSTGVGLLDILSRRVSKAAALSRLLGRWGIPQGETLAIGDNWNDLEMLEAAGLGLVMGNADPRLQELGFPVLPTNEEDGVAFALERYLLEGWEQKKEG